MLFICSQFTLELHSNVIQINEVHFISLHLCYACLWITCKAPGLNQTAILSQILIVAHYETQLSNANCNQHVWSHDWDDKTNAGQSKQESESPQIIKRWYRPAQNYTITHCTVHDSRLHQADMDSDLERLKWQQLLEPGAAVAQP